MTGVYFNHPGTLWLCAALPLLGVAGWWTLSGLRPAARIVTTCVRALALALGIIALADPVMEIPTMQTVVPKVYLLRDRSGSIGNNSFAIDSLESAIQSAAGGVQFQKLSFAGGIWRAGQPPIETNQTDIAAALDNIAGAPGQRDGEQVVLLTDGNSTRGLPIDAATRLAMRGARVHVLPIGKHIDQNVHFVDIDPPLGARVGISDGVRVTLSSDIPESATIRLVDANNHITDQRTIPFPGKPTLILHFDPTDAGLQNYRIEVRTGEKLIESQAIPVYVNGPPRILIVDNVPDEAALLAQAVRGLHVPVDVISADHFPEDLSSYAEIILSDLSGKEFSPDQRGAIRQFVETDGGGLIFIGGSNTIASRWNDNPLGNLLPVELRDRPVKVIKKTPDVSVVFVLDCSGSMKETLPGTTGNVSKLEMVKAATIASLQAMPETAHISVISFEWQTHMIVPPTSIDHRQEIGTRVDSILCGGGTVMYPAISDGIKILEGMSGNKYLIVLTDGDSDPPPSKASWDDLSAKALVDGISWTSIGVGTDADEKLLRNLAVRAGGRYAYCGTGDSIPKVFVERARAMRQISQSQQPPFVPLAGPNLSDLPNLKSQKFPALTGNVLSVPRPDSHLLLLTDKRDPLLASWQFGAGKVFAFCSDAKNLWSKSWIASPVFPKLWATIAAAVARPIAPLNAIVRKTVQGNHVMLTYRVRDANGQFVDELKPSVSIHPKIPGNAVWELPQPGTYQISFNLPADNSPHDIEVQLRDPRHGSLDHDCILTGATSLELSATGPDLAACEQIADAGQGVCSMDPRTIAKAIHSDRPSNHFISRRPLWPWLVGAMICLWPLDVLLRKIL